MKKSDFIKKNWIVENNSSLITKKTGDLIGDGRFELIFVVGKGYTTKRNNIIEVIKEGIYLGGQMNIPMDLEIYPTTKLYFIKIEPWVAQLLSSISFDEALNKTVSLKDINSSLYQKLMDYNPASQMDQIIQELLHYFEYKKNDTKTSLLTSCCKILDSGYIDFKAARDNYIHSTGISTRRIEQIFKHNIGLSPQQYSNGIRLRLISEQIIHYPKNFPFTDLTYKYGFFDQAHFIRFFKKYWGFSPKFLNTSNAFITNSSEPFRYYTI